MKYFFLSSLIFILSTSFSNMKIEPTLKDKKFKPDVSINKIKLNSQKNIDDYLGSDVMERLTDAPNYQSYVLSRDGNQKFTFYFHPGGTKKEFAEFKVEYADSTDDNARRVKDKEFKTESGIKLGILIDKLKAIKGKPHKTVDGEIKTLQYIIDDIDNSKFLQKHNSHLYYAKYTFKEGVLIEFIFGFEYP